MMLKNKTMIWFAAALGVAGCAQSQLASSSGYGQRGKRKHVYERRVMDAPSAKPARILPATFFAAGQLFEGQGLRDQAIMQYRKAVAVNHKYVAAYHRLGLILSASGARDEALAALQRAVELKPSSAVLHNNLGFEYLLHERWADALKQFDLAIKRDSHFVRAFINRGMALSRLDRLDEALVSFRAVLPEADAYYNLGLMLRGLQRFEAAARQFAHVLDIDPYFSAAQWQLQELTPRLEARVWNPPIPLEPPQRPFPALLDEPFVDASAYDMFLPVREELPKFATPLETWVVEKVDDFEPNREVDGPWRDEALQTLERYASALPSPVPARPVLEGFTFAGPPSPYDMDEMLAIVHNEIQCLEELEAEQKFAFATVDEEEAFVRAQLAVARLESTDLALFDVFFDPSTECRADQSSVCFATWVGTPLDEAQSTCAGDARMAMEWGEPFDTGIVGPVSQPRPTLGLKAVPENEDEDQDGPIYDNEGLPRDTRPENRGNIAPNKTRREDNAPGMSSTSWPQDWARRASKDQVVKTAAVFEDLLGELAVVENETRCIESIESDNDDSVTPPVVTSSQRRAPIRD